MPPPGDAAEGEGREEVDLWWGGYAGRTMVPAFLLCVLLTAAIVVVAWLLGAWRGATAVRYTAQVLMAGIWLFQILRWAYRTATTNYRLTTRHVFVQRGLSHPGTPGIDLTRIKEIRAECGPLERLLGVGRVQIILEEAAAPPLVLLGLRNPQHIAREIRRQVEQRRQETS